MFFKRKIKLGLKQIILIQLIIYSSISCINKNNNLREDQNIESKQSHLKINKKSSGFNKSIYKQNQNSQSLLNKTKNIQKTNYKNIDETTISNKTSYFKNEPSIKIKIKNIKAGFHIHIHIHHLFHKVAHAAKNFEHKVKKTVHTVAKDVDKGVEVVQKISKTVTKIVDVTRKVLDKVTKFVDMVPGLSEIVDSCLEACDIPPLEEIDKAVDATDDALHKLNMILNMANKILQQVELITKNKKSTPEQKTQALKDKDAANNTITKANERKKPTIKKEKRFRS